MIDANSPKVYDSVMATSRTIIFADGENLAIRYQELLKTKKLNPNVKYIPDVFVWHQNVSTCRAWDLIRVSYYTSMVGDDDAVNKLRNEIAAVRYPYRTNIEHVYTVEGRMCPHVFKRSNKSQKSKIVDISLAIDVLRHTYNDSLDIVFLLSGDGDYLPIIKEVMRTGKRVVVGAFSSGLNPEIPATADDFIDLDKWFFLSQ